MSVLKHKCDGYDASFKLNIFQFGHILSNNWETAAEFGISEKTNFRLVQICEQIIRNASYK